MKTLVIDTETTGIEMGSEILQLSIIDGEGNTDYNQYFKPEKATSWEGAQKVNGISPEMVADKPCISERLPEIQKIFDNADTIIGYNTPFDIGMLKHAGINFKPELKHIDVMQDFAEIYGEWSESRQGFKWQKLIKCAEYYGYDWGTDTAHDSLSDCRATLFCHKQMQINPVRTAADDITVRTAQPTVANLTRGRIVGEQKEKDLSIIQSNPMKLRDGGRQR